MRGVILSLRKFKVKVRKIVMKNKALIKFKPSFIELERRIEYAPPYKAQQQRQAAVKGMVCHEGEVITHNEEVVTN